MSNANVVAYVRVSTAEQFEHGHSISEQSSRIKSYCDAMNWNLVKIFTDGGFSGGNTDRPALKEMIRKIEKQQIDKVIVYKLDRLSRSQKDTLNLIEEVFLKNNTDFVSICENFDTSTAFGRAMIGILAVFAQLEREQIKERMKMGKVARAKQGNFMGTWQVPIGYDYIDGELVTNEFEKIQIQNIFKWYSQGVSPVKIADRLNESGMTQKNGKWLPYTIRQILDRKTYLGYIFYSGEWYKGTHEAFIDQELFDKVQMIRKKKADEFKQHNHKAGKATSYFSGIAYCARCGAKYVKQCSQSSRNGQRYYIQYYKCASRAQKSKYYRIIAERCDNKNYRMEEFDKMIFDEIQKLAFDPEYFEKNQQRDTDSDKQTEVINSEIKKIEDQIRNLIDLYSVSGIPVEELQEKIKALDEQRDKLEKRLDDMKANESLKLSPEEARSVIESFSDILENADLEEVRSAINILIDKIVIDGENVDIYWNF